MSGRRVTGASLLAGADADDVWPVEHRLTNADRADVMRISLKLAGVGLQVPQKYPASFETELLAALLPERLRPTELDRKTGLLKCQHTILGKLVSRDEIKRVINKTHADGKVTANTWHVHILDGFLEGRPYLESLVALQNEVREHYRPQRLRVLELARSVHPGARADSPSVVKDLAEASQAASISPAAGHASTAGAAGAVAAPTPSPAAAGASADAGGSDQFASPLLPTKVTVAQPASRREVEATPAAQPAKRNKAQSGSKPAPAPAPARVSPLAPTPSRDDVEAAGNKRKASPLPAVDDATPAAARLSALASAAVRAPSMPAPAAQLQRAPAPAALAPAPSAAPAAAAAADSGDRSWLIVTDARVEYRQLVATQPQKLVALEKALYKMLERVDSTTLDALYCELHRAGLSTVRTNEVLAFLAKREADGHIMTDFPDIFRI